MESLAKIKAELATILEQLESEAHDAVSAADYAQRVAHEKTDLLNHEKLNFEKALALHQLITQQINTTLRNGCNYVDINFCKLNESYTVDTVDIVDDFLEADGYKVENLIDLEYSYTPYDPITGQKVCRYYKDGKYKPVEFFCGTWRITQKNESFN